MTRTWSVAGLAAAAAGMVLQIAAGSALYPTIPPGPIILLAAAGIVAWGPRRWAPYVATLVSAFVIVGGSIAAITDASDSLIVQLTDIGALGVFSGTVLQLIGLTVALIAGIAIWRGRGYRR